MKKIEEIIKNLKNIEPDDEYKAKSLGLILATNQNQKTKFNFTFSDITKYVIAIGLTSVIIVFSLSDAFVGLNAKLLSPILFSNLDKEKIQAEASQVNIKISISEAKYYNDSVNKVAVALNETAQDAPGHLNQTLIEKEMRGLDSINSDSNQDINDLLNKLIL